MWLILLYAIVVAAIVALAVGAVSQEQLGKVRAGMAQLKPIQPTTDPNQQPAAPVVYQVGDVVNGHRFDGTRWIPLE